MKTLMTINVDVAVAAALKTKAAAAGTSASRLAERLLASALNVTDEVAPKPLTKKERLIVDAWKRLRAKHEGTDHPKAVDAWYTLPQWAREAGLYPSEALGALRSLQGKGILSHDESVPVEAIGQPAALQREVEHWTVKRGVTLP